MKGGRCLHARARASERPSAHTGVVLARALALTEFRRRRRAINECYCCCFHNGGDGGGDGGSGGERALAVQKVLQ